MLYVLLRAETTSAAINVSNRSPSAALHKVLGEKRALKMAFSHVSDLSWRCVFKTQIRWHWHLYTSDKLKKNPFLMQLIHNLKKQIIIANIYHTSGHIAVSDLTFQMMSFTNAHNRQIWLNNVLE